MRLSSLLLITLPLMGCEQQIRLGVEQTISTLPNILEDHVVNNLIRIKGDQYAPIAQVLIKESISTAQNGFDYGIAPNIALRAIAVTGINLSASNSLNENLIVDPVNGSLDQRRLQILFGYAVRGDFKHPTPFMEFRKKLLEQTGFYTTEDDKETVLNIVNRTLPDLPDGPFAEINAPNCDLVRDHIVRATLSLTTVCFRGQNPGLNGREIASLLVLWSVAIPELSQFVNQPGKSKGGNTGVAISTPSH